MGYEYKITLSATDEEREGLIDFIEQLKSKNDSLARHAPSVTVQQEDDGLYICQFWSSNVWQGLEALREYLAKRKLRYTVEEL